MKNALLKLAFFAALFAAGYWIAVATKKERPQPTTHYEYTQFRFREMKKVVDEWVVCYVVKYYLTNGIDQVIMSSNLTYTADEALNVYGGEGWKVKDVVPDPEEQGWTCYVLEKPFELDGVRIYVGQTIVHTP